MLRRDERGQAVPLALVVVALAILATAAIAELGGNVVDAGRARTAADAAALAGVEGGREASARVAADNGATLVSWSSRSDGDCGHGHRDGAHRAGDGDRSSHESRTVRAWPARATAEALRTLDVMASTERPDAIAPADADAKDSLPAVRQRRCRAERLRNLSPSESDVPATSDDSGPLALGSATTHELLEPAGTMATRSRRTEPPSLASW